MSSTAAFAMGQPRALGSATCLANRAKAALICLRGSLGCRLAMASQVCQKLASCSRSHSATNWSLEGKFRYRLILVVSASAAIVSTPTARIPLRQKRSEAVSKMRLRARGRFDLRFPGGRGCGCPLGLDRDLAILNLLLTRELPVSIIP